MLVFSEPLLLDDVAFAARLCTTFFAAPRSLCCSMMSPLLLDYVPPSFVYFSIMFTVEVVVTRCRIVLVSLLTLSSIASFGSQNEKK